MLFIGAKVTHLGAAAAGPAGARRPGASAWSTSTTHEGFGGCTNIGECTAACPKGIPLDVIAQLNKDLRHALTHGE